MSSEEEGGGAGGGVLRIGYALSPKKAESFITPSLLNLAKQRGILLLPVDLTKPLIIQQQQQQGGGGGGGRFHCIIHKLSSPDWYDQLIEFSSKFPSVPIIDPPHAIQRLHDRVSMLQVVADLQIPPCSSCSFGIPNQVCVRDTSQLAGLLLLLPPPSLESSKDLEFPVIAKPLVADGTPKSHQMSLVFNREGLNELEMETPFVLQQFVNHGGVIFKVYVVGDYVKCVKRRSLPDITDGDGSDNINSMSFSQISNLAANSRSNDSNNDLDAMEMPPLSFLNYLASALRGALKLHLFNFDVIRDVTATKSPSDHYCIIDINYFPGYAKMPSYETVLTDFFLGIHHQPPNSSSFNAAATGGSC